ncbi:MAG: hypothetical protein HY704_16050 [Gemmatimonadetes bacterium]|nr:hypothetical protein [Gemmatimonadota bacterium]
MQLIDAGMIAYAAWHALEGRVQWPLTFQVPRMLRALLVDAGDTYVLCWNAERLRKRERWPAYRNRPEIWDHAGHADFAAMIRVLAALGAVQYRADGWEADEVIAALVHRFEGDEKLVIRSDDKDFMQLLSKTTWMEGKRRGKVRFDDVEEVLGVPAKFVADFLALAGDDADGIPRIVTPASARKLIREQRHVLDWIGKPLERLDVDEKLMRTLESSREQLRLNLELADLSAEAVGEPPDPLLEGWGDLAVARSVGELTGIGYLSGKDLADEFLALREWGGRTRERLGV